MINVTVENDTDISIAISTENVNVAVQTVPINISVATAGLQGPPGTSSPEEILSYVLIFS